MPKIDMISSSVVKRESNEMNATAISRLELNSWDLRLLPIVPIQRALLYHKPQSHNFINHLKNSLSRTLDFFPPLAGRLAATGKETFFVDCNNTGAEFTHAVAATVSVSDIIEPSYIPVEIVYSLFPLDDTTNYDGVSKPLLAVQVTELADGLFIGCAANHAVVDGTSFWHFLNSWSEITRGLHTISVTPIFHRSIAPIKVDVGNNQLPPLDQNRPILLRKVFHFSKESLRKLKAKANSEIGSEKISSYQALSALLWRSTTRCQKPQKNHNPSSREMNFTLIVGARSRMGLGDGYFGNAIYSCAISATERELLENGIGHVALKINELLNRQTSEAAIQNFEDSENRGLIRKWPSFFIIGSPRHDVYGNDFGWGKLIAARSGKGRDMDGKMTIWPAAESGGVYLEVSLATEKMLAMEDDPEFIAALAICNS